METTLYVIGDKVERIPFDKKGRYKLQVSGGDIRYTIDGQDPIREKGERLRVGSNLNLEVKNKPIDFRAIKSGEENGMLTIISLGNINVE